MHTLTKVSEVWSADPQQTYDQTAAAALFWWPDGEWDIRWSVSGRHWQILRRISQPAPGKVLG